MPHVDTTESIRLSRNVAGTRNSGRASYHELVCGTHASATISRASGRLHLNNASSTKTPPGSRIGTCIIVTDCIACSHCTGHAGYTIRLMTVRTPPPANATLIWRRLVADASRASPRLGLTATIHASDGIHSAAV